VRQQRASGITSIVTDTVEQFGIAYDIHSWLRYLTWLAIASAAYLLLHISGGFPPPAWYLLLRTAPQIPHLFSMRGAAILFPLLGLVALSLTWLALWCVLLWAGLAAVGHWWYSTSSQQAHTSRLEQSKQARARDEAVDDVGIGWDTGIVRRSRPNEDSLVALRSTCTHNGRILPIDLYVVADGMGGHSQGQEASRLAIQYMLQAVLSGILAREQLDDDSFIKILVDAVQRANRVVHENSQADGIEMGTTITAALVFDGTAYVVNVGDSRTYIYRASDGKLSQVTRDHSLVARLVEAGAITRDEVYTHPDRNKVYRGLGEKGEVKVDWFSIPVQPGDHLVLCSDGLWEMVRDQEIERILKKHAANPPRASAALVEAALQGGGADNISVIVVRIG
jgi:serine/threonine protein phosphatase PrpC